jgi:hypothetical protein
MQIHVQVWEVDKLPNRATRIDPRGYNSKPLPGN